MKYIYLSFLLLMLFYCESAMSSMYSQGFAQPLVIGNKIFSISYDNAEAISVNLDDGKVEWRKSLGRNPQYGLIWRSYLSRIIVSGMEQISVIDSKTGEIEKRIDVPGTVVGSSTNGCIYSVSGSVLLCLSVIDDNVIWRTNIDPVGDSVPHFLQYGGVVFVTLLPSIASGNTIYRGLHELLCLSARNGVILWREELKVDDEDSCCNGFVHIDDSNTSVVCSHLNDIWLICKLTGKMIAHGVLPVSSRGVAFWGDRKILVPYRVLETNDCGLLLLSGNKLNIESMFTLKTKLDPNRIVLGVIGDVLRWGQLRVDLISRKEIMLPSYMSGMTYCHLLTAEPLDRFIYIGGHKDYGKANFLGAIDLLNNKVRIIRAEHNSLDAQHQPENEILSIRQRRAYGIKPRGLTDAELGAFETRGHVLTIDIFKREQTKERGQTEKGENRAK